MRRAIAWFVEGLPFDARSRRAMEETLLDWEEEAAQSATATERTVTELRGVASILRVMSLSVLRESVDFSWMRGLGRRFAVAGWIVVGLALLMTTVAMLETGIQASRFLLLTPALMQGVMPEALFLIIAWRPVGQKIPSLGSAFLGGAVAVFAIALLAISAGRLFIRLSLQDIGAMVSDPELTRRLAAIAEQPLAPYLILSGVAWSLFAGAFAVLAASLAQKSGLRSAWWLVAVPILCSVVPRAVAVGTGRVFFDFPMLEYRLASDTAAMLLLAVAVLVLAAMLGRNRAPRETAEV